MKTPNNRAMHGVSGVLTAAIIIVLAVAGVGGYYILKGAGSSSSSLSGSSSSLSSSSSTSTSQTTTSSENTSGLENFRGIFQWSSNSSTIFEGKPLNTTERASGSFKVSISLSNDTGQGSGQGQATFEWGGQCTGQNSSSHTFTISAELSPTATGTNLSIYFGPANPGISTVVRTCQSFGSTTETWSWAAVGAPSPVSIAQGQTIEGANSFDFGNVVYEITLLQD